MGLKMVKKKKKIFPLRFLRKYYYYIGFIAHIEGDKDSLLIEWSIIIQKAYYSFNESSKFLW